MQIPILEFRGVLDSRLLDKRISQFKDLISEGHEKMYFIIDSFGGEMDAVTRFYNCVAAHSEIEIYSKIYQAQSGGAIIALLGSYRTIQIGSEIRFHLGSVNIEAVSISDEGKFTNPSYVKKLREGIGDHLKIIQTKC